MESMRVSGIFMWIKVPPHKPDSPDSKTRIYVMDLPSGRLYDGLLATRDVRSLKLRDRIDVNLEDPHPAKATDVFEPQNSKRFDMQMEDYLKDGVFDDISGFY